MLFNYPYFEDIPIIEYDEDRRGWDNVCHGIFSPFSSKYKTYIKSVNRKKRKEGI